ncbi:MAG: protoglobin domain-containing protein [Pirellulales bacterium]
MNSQELFDRYCGLQRYVGWTDEDASRLQIVCRLVQPRISALIDDFYAEIERHPAARKVINGGDSQVNRLKGTLRLWMEQLLTGPYDQAYVSRRWQVGLRHVEIGLDQVYTNAALARMRQGMLAVIGESWDEKPELLLPCIGSLLRLIDLDLAVIEDAYQHAHVQQQKRIDRLVALGQMAAGIAHEMRNPLNVIQTSVYFLQHAADPSPEKRLQHLERIQRQVLVAESVVSAMYDFAKMPLPEFVPVQVKGLLEEALANQEASRRAKTVIHCEPESLNLLGDRKQLLVVLGNLIRNALDAMPQGGELRLGASRQANWVVLTVEDEGVGIQSDQIHKVFEPFHSDKARGLGLGLAICRSIVENHHGIISVASSPGEGTRFTVRLPAETN